ncbi:MAG: helix-turn-helix domain-containing protein [Firmicutes bacterium]|nr:helix-turn-helix domain-containing protein [Bacillota bacterium]
MASNMTLGQKIKQYRKRHAMTQGELAAKIGVEPLHITNIENGKKGISLDKLILICKCLHVSLAEVLPIEGQDDFELRQRWTEEIVSAIDGLDIAQLGTVKTMVCSLLAE